MTDIIVSCKNFEHTSTNKMLSHPITPQKKKHKRNKISLQIFTWLWKTSFFPLLWLVLFVGPRVFLFPLQHPFYIIVTKKGKNSTKYIRRLQSVKQLSKNTLLYYMANPALGKSLCSDWFFLGQDFAVQTVSMEQSNPCIFVLEPSWQIQHLQPRQRKKSVKLVILHIETTSRS